MEETNEFIRRHTPEILLAAQDPENLRLLAAHVAADGLMRAIYDIRGFPEVVIVEGLDHGGVSPNDSTYTLSTPGKVGRVVVSRALILMAAEKLELE